MKLLIAAATQHEISPFLQSPLLRHTDVLITGVGIAAATFQLTKRLHHEHYDLVIQAGVAGTFSASYPLGSVVLAGQDCFGDAGAFENGQFQSLTDMGFSTELEWIHNSHPMLAQLQLPVVRAITVGTITNHPDYTNALRQKYAPDIETMEGAALHYVCQHLHKPYLQLRSISNAVGERNKELWELPAAIANLNATLQQLVQHLKGAA
ncbi:MAG: futalosine hydrolase [Bacteroidetes bacterium]|nr:MAG: futalosine hydrolase [Bacteroidota bacterium]